MVTISVDTRDLDRLTRFVAQSRGQMRFATSKALNSLAFDVRDQVRSTMPQNFTIRRRWVVNQLQVRKKATKADLEAVVGTSEPGKFLAKHEEGGTRTALGRYIAIPTRAVKRTKTDQIRKSDRPANLGAKATVVDYDGNKWLALNKSRKWAQGSASKTRLLYLLKPRTQIDERLELHEKGQAVIRTKGSQALKDAVDYALKTAR
ncbi:MAG: DUF6441 family protein [Cyanobacteriota bacterium]|nr:DUF6441 family protein [Cyanobacteriota bacterium]